MGGVSLGLALATLPFLHYATGGGHTGPHENHAARHGGQLGMVGDYHLEVVRRDGRIEVFVSDAYRHPVAPTRGWMRFDQGPQQPLRWERYRLVGAADMNATEVTCDVMLPDGRGLSLTFALG